MGYNKAVTIACEFSGYPAPVVKMVNESSGEEVALGNSSAKLTLRTDSNDDFGKFNCSAVNTYGTKQFLVELKVAGMLHTFFVLFLLFVFKLKPPIKIV